MLGHRNRDNEEIREAKNRVRLKKSIFSTKKEFRQIFNDFMAPRSTDNGSSTKMLRRQASMKGSSPEASNFSNLHLKPFDNQK